MLSFPDLFSQQSELLVEGARTLERKHLVESITRSDCRIFNDLLIEPWTPHWFLNLLEIDILSDLCFPVRWLIDIMPHLDQICLVIIEPKAFPFQPCNLDRSQTLDSDEAKCNMVFRLVLKIVQEQSDFIGCWHWIKIHSSYDYAIVLCYCSFRSKQ